MFDCHIPQFAKLSVLRALILNTMQLSLSLLCTMFVEVASGDRFTTTFHEFCTPLLFLNVFLLSSFSTLTEYDGRVPTSSGV